MSGGRSCAHTGRFSTRLKVLVLQIYIAVLGFAVGLSIAILS